MAIDSHHTTTFRRFSMKISGPHHARWMKSQPTQSWKMFDHLHTAVAFSSDEFLPHKQKRVRFWIRVLLWASKAGPKMGPYSGPLFCRMGASELSPGSLRTHPFAACYAEFIAEWPGRGRVGVGSGRVVVRRGAGVWPGRGRVGFGVGLVPIKQTGSFPHGEKRA